MAPVVGSSTQKKWPYWYFKNSDMSTFMTKNWWWREYFSHNRGEK